MRQGSKRPYRRYLVGASVAAIAAVLLAQEPALAQWPQWGGPARDFTVNAGDLASSWPQDGPRKVWSRPLGQGYSGIIVDDGRLITMYRSEDDDVVIALDPSSGATLWEFSYPAPMIDGIDTRFGWGPNATPLAHGDRVYAFGITGRLQCLTKKTGEQVWLHDLVEEFSAEPPEFGFSASPLAYKNLLLVPGGGKGCGMFAFNLADGSLVWRKHDFENVYSSPIIITVGGEDQVVLLTDRAVVGMDPKTGERKWEHPHVNQWRTNIFTPLFGRGNLLFISSSGEAGSKMLELSNNNGKMQVKELWSNRKVTIGQTNAVWIKDYLYGCSATETTSLITCVDARTGETAWRERGFSQSMLLHADGKFIILDQEGVLGLVTATPKEFSIKSKAQLLGQPAWTAPTLVGQRLYLRDRKNIMALDIG